LVEFGMHLSKPIVYGWSPVFAERRKTFSDVRPGELRRTGVCNFDHGNKTGHCPKIEEKVFVDQIPGARTRMVSAFIDNPVTERCAI
jgi:hypothetical protein